MRSLLGNVTYFVNTRHISFALWKSYGRKMEETSSNICMYVISEGFFMTGLEGEVTLKYRLTKNTSVFGVGVEIN